MGLNWATGKTFSTLRFYKEGGKEGRGQGEKYHKCVKAPRDLSPRVGNAGWNEGH